MLFFIRVKFKIQLHKLYFEALITVTAVSQDRSKDLFTQRKGLHFKVSNSKRFGFYN